ncbi:bifunctional folylpolyglutamate synthase/dihydrofolate synthase [Christiangramia sabulilitoris]|uniref:Dihydrofolate synthase/folylpolyglutamate synthase n=1 Tax=Christiangramia sabulilitoris TaxID=2583991 RepID=A0A550I4L4_9FLAO|nr:bifunctional folylpolyglutamate synthase/dihydrofolate synthase [Christiangramia sabulilitoris]
MFQQLPMFQRIGKQAFKKDLTNTLKLVEHLDHPERKFRSVHVAGTNGKGSVCHMLASVFQAAGYKTGLYTSPHLKDFRERIRINGEVIPEEEVISFISRNKAFLKANKLSFFEMTVGMAFDYFAKQKVDIAIIETGMGGRLDSTNIIIPELSVITNIGLDHTSFLGNDLASIATEKAGIIKKNVPVVIGEKHPETSAVFKEKAEASIAEIEFAEDNSFPFFDSDLKGIYQRKNLNTVLSSLMILKKDGWNFSEEHIRKGLNNVIQNTGLRGRWEILKENPKVICDTAHNTEGLKIVLEQLNRESFEHLHIILGVVNDKDLAGVLPLFPKQATFYFAKPDVPRGLDAYALQESAGKFGLKGNVFPSVELAYKKALENATAQDLIFVGGSNFTVAEVL